MRWRTYANRVSDTEPRAVVADGVELPIDDEAARRAEQNIGEQIIVGGAWRTVAYGFSTVIAVIATAIISREIGPAGFADFATALSLIAVAMLISDFGLLALGVREYAALSGEARRRSYQALISLRFVFGVVAGTLIVTFAIAAGYSAGLIVGICFAALAVPVGSIASSYTVPLQANYRLNLLAGIDALRQALTSSLMVTLALTTASVGAIIATNLPVTVVLTIVVALLIRGEASLRPSFDLTAMRGLLGDVGTFAVAASIGMMYPYISQVISNSQLDPHEAGQFGLTFRVFAVALAGWIVVVSGAFPLLVTSSREDVKRMVFATRRLIQASLLVGIACAVGLLTGADFIVAALGGEEYSGAAKLIAIIGIALPATFTLITGNTVLLASGRHRELIKVSVTGALVSIGLTCFASIKWGSTGSASGIVIGEVLIASGYIWMVSRIDATALPRMAWLLRAVLAGLLGAAAALLGIPSLLAAVLGGALFLVAGLLLRIFPPELTDRIPFGSAAKA